MRVCWLAVTCMQHLPHPNCCIIPDVTRPPCWPRGDKALCARTTLHPRPGSTTDHNKELAKMSKIKPPTTYVPRCILLFHALHADANHVIMIINANHLLLYNTENYYVCSRSLDLDSFSNLSYAWKEIFYLVREFTAGGFIQRGCPNDTADGRVHSQS